MEGDVASTTKTQAMNQQTETKIDQYGGTTKAAEKNYDSDKQALSRCLVYCRLRPMNRTDHKDGGFKLVTVDKDSVYIKDQRRYDFDGAFDENCTQEHVFQTVALPCIEHAFNGFCSALMCYGQTGTGKSFTMCNMTPGNEGIIPRAAKYIFEKVNANSSDWNYNIFGQYVQVYRDHIGDLMVGDGRERVEIRFDDEEGVEFTGCTSHTLRCEADFIRFYQSGSERRVVTATAMNPESSRGHTALVIRIISERADDTTGNKIKGKITFIDLAGYERFSKTGIAYDNIIMKDEAKCINASLLSLGHVVSALSSGGRHIPWRNSKLTRILQDSIGGRSRTSIILTVGPSSDHIHETTNSLQFGLRAMDVKVAAKQNVLVDYQKLARKLQLLLDEKSEKICLLELQIASRDAERNELMERYSHHRRRIDERYQSDMENLRNSAASEEQLRNLRELYNTELENLQEQQQEEIQYQEEAHSLKITTLMREQEQNEAKRRAAAKLEHERIIEDFQKKLAASREGKNDDLANALQQLAEKDSLLALRANDTARLREHIEVLTEQIKDMGGTPIEGAELPETFLDVSQVQEIQERLEAEVERYKEKAASLGAEVERLGKLCTERLDELNKLNEENSELRQYLEQSGIQLPGTDELTEFLRDRCTKMVDRTALETLRVTMQTNIDELSAYNAELVKEVDRLEEERSQFSLPLTARIRGGGHSFLNTARCVLPSYHLLSPRRAFPESTRNSFTQHKEMRSFSFLANSETNVAPKALRQLTDQLAHSAREKNSLRERVQTLESMLALQNTEAGKPYVPPINLKFSGLQPAEVASESPAEEYAENDVDVLLRVKDEEIDSLLETIERQEYLLSTARSNEEFNQRMINELKKKILAAQLELPEEQAVLPPVKSIAMDDYMNILRLLRDGERKLAARLVANGDGDVSGDVIAVEALLEERDVKIQSKDELLMQKASEVEFIVRICVRLKKQLECRGITPCCQLPDSYRDLVSKEEQMMGEQMVFQREMEEQMLADEEEKIQLKKMLKFLHDEREKTADVIKSAQARCREVEERESASTAALQRVLKERTQREMLLEKSLRYLTVQLREKEEILRRNPEKRGFLEKLSKFFKY